MGIHQEIKSPKHSHQDLGHCCLLKIFPSSGSLQFRWCKSTVDLHASKQILEIAMSLKIISTLSYDLASKSQSHASIVISKEQMSAEMLGFLLSDGQTWVASSAACCILFNIQDCP